MNIMKKDMDVNAKCSLFERISCCCGSIGMTIPYYVASIYFLYFCTNYLGLNPGIIGTIFLASKCLDGVSDLVMGTIIDRTNSKMGKARVWILRGCIPHGITAILLFSIPASLPNAIIYVFVFVFYNLLNTVTYTCVCTSTSTLNCLMTKNQYERGILGIFSMLGVVAAQTFVNSFTLAFVKAFGDNRGAWTVTITIFSIISVILMLTCVKGVTERVTLSREKDEKAKEPPIKEAILAIVKNKYWLMFTAVYTLISLYAAAYMSSVIYYCTVCLGNENYQPYLMDAVTIFQMLALMCSFILIKHLGKAKTFLVGVAGMLIAMAIKEIGGDVFTIHLAMSAVIGITMGFASSVVNGMCSDTVEYGEWKTGIRTEGLAFGGMSMAAKIGGGIGAALLGWLLAWGGYDANATVQTAKTVFAIKACYNYLPFIFCAIMFVIMLFFKLDEIYPQIMKDLEERRNHAAQTTEEEKRN